ncbi:MAG: nucleotidyltransferase domain-containing protein [Firmicutes bacterium]|nr:nucleotidyltransferase domain-containing protein [Bacillota bacterium]
MGPHVLQVRPSTPRRPHPRRADAAPPAVPPLAPTLPLGPSHPRHEGHAPPCRLSAPSTLYWRKGDGGTVPDRDLAERVDKEVLGSVCREYRVRELALFGSALRSDFGPASDVDVLVDFLPDSPVRASSTSSGSSMCSRTGYFTKTSTLWRMEG